MTWSALRLRPAWAGPADSAAVVAADDRSAPNFSGYRWDRQFQVWVLWQNGRPVEVYEAGAE